MWVQNLNQANTGNVTVTATGATVSSTQYGIRALTAGSGKISATIDANSTINSGGTGVSVINFDTAIDPSAGSMIIVTASGTISSGSTLNLNGSTPKGIDVGYYGAASGAATVNPNVNGSVLVNSSALITAAGYGINAYNYGNGDVTVNDTGGSINAGAIGIAAYAESTGTGNVAINVASQATIGTTGVTAGTGAILGFSTNTGVSGGTPVANSANVSIISAGTINSTGSGIVAVNESSTVSPVADSSILVTNSGAISSGTVLTGSNNQPAGILAGYLGGTAPPASGAWPVSGVFGNVTVNNSADITAAAGDGIRAYNYGTGDVTVNDSSGTIKASLNNPSPVNGSGIGISAYNYGPGNITVMTGVGTTIDAQSSGIFAINEASVAPAASSISVTAYGAINPGFVQTANLSPAAGILAGFQANGVANPAPNVQGNVSITDYAQISAPAASDGIRGFNYGTGNIQITVEPGVTISAGHFGVAGNANGGGNVQITNNGNVTGTSAGLEATAVTSGGLTGAITITNNGTIANSAGAGSPAISINKPTNAILTINNNGTITGTVGLGSGTTFYDNAGATWSSSGVTDNATLVVAGAGSVVAVSGGLTVAGGSGNIGFLTADSGSRLNVGTSFVVGNSGSGNVLLENGAILNAGSANVANNAGSTGALTIQGTGTSFNLNPATSGFWIVGNSGNATATVQSGATVNVYGINIGSSTGGSGSLTVDGAGTSLQSSDLSLTSSGAKVIIAGFSGAGTFTVSGGASVNADSVNIGQQTGSHGTVTVTGAGTSLTTTSGFFQNLQIGSLGSANFTISNGAAVTTTTMTVAADAVSGVIDMVDVNDATLNVSQYLTIGYLGAANVTFEGAATVNATNISIANNAGSSAIVTLTGAGTIVTASSLSMGSLGGAAALNVANNASLDVGTGATPIAGAIHLSGAGSIFGAGTIDANIVTDNGATIDASGGTLFLDTDYTINNAGLLQATSSGTLQLNGAVNNSGSISANAGSVLVGGGATVTGTASVTITGSGFADFVGALGSPLLLNAAFSGASAGTLELDHSRQYGGTVSGFATGDAIDLTDLHYANPETVTWTQNGASGTLTISNGTTTDSLNLAGIYSQGNFALTSDAGGGTKLVSSPTTVTLAGLNASGNAVRGQGVTISLGATNLGTVTYTWLLNGQVVQGDTTNGYTPTLTDQGKTLDVIASFTDPATTKVDQVTAVAGTVQQNPNFDDWTGAANDGNWSTAGNWNNGVPTSMMTAELDLGGTYNVTSSGTVTVNGLGGSPTATLNIAGGNFTVTNYAGQGPLILSGGTFGVGSSTATIAALTQTGGTLSGTGTLTVTGLTTFSSGTQSGLGTLIAQGGVNAQGASSASITLDGGRTLQLGGTSTMSGQYVQINLNSTNASTFGTLTIDNGAILNDTTSGGFLEIYAGVGTSSVVNNYGTLNKTGSSTQSSISTAFNNYGTVNVQAGTLDLTGGGTETGTFSIASGATVELSSAITLNGASSTGLGQLQLASSTLTVNSTATLGSGFTQTGGTLSGTGTVTVTGLTTLSSGTLSGTGTLIAQGGVNAQGASSASITLDGGRTLQLGGTSTMSGQYVQINLNSTNASTSGTLTIDNGAILNDTTSGGFLEIYAGVGTSSVVNNYGTLNKTGSSTQSSISTAFNNYGTVNVQSGTLDIGGAATGVGAYTIGTASNSATLEFDSSVAAGATVTFEGSAGTLLIMHPSSFSISNVISGITGAGDVLDLRGFASGSDMVTASSTDTILTVSDTTAGHTATVQLTLQGGDYSTSTWSVTGDGNGGFKIVDPPAAATATIASGTSLDIGTSSHATVTFTGNTGALVLEQPQNFTGHIAGFTGTAPDAAHSDTIDLVGIDYNSSHFAESYNSSTGLLSVTDGSHTAGFTFDNFNATLDFASDGNGGTLITDPPPTNSGAPSVSTSATSEGVSGSITFAAANSASAETASFTPDGSNYLGSFSLGHVTENNGAASVEFNFNNDQINLAPGQTLTQSYNVGVADPQNPAGTMNQTVSVSIGGSGSDNFVFKPGIGADTVVNFNTQHDTIELDNFSSAQTVQQLQTLITTDIHGDAVIELGHGDSITLAGTTAQQLQAIVHGSVHLH